VALSKVWAKDERRVENSTTDLVLDATHSSKGLGSGFSSTIAAVTRWLWWDPIFNWEMVEQLSGEAQPPNCPNFFGG